MMKPLSFLCAACLLLPPSLAAADADPSRVLPANEKPKDARLSGKLKTLDDYFPMQVPKTRQEWEARRTALREQVKVATGVWPMPEKTPLKPVIHGKIERDGYTIEKVFFASLPGHYVTGNLYRPRNQKGEVPGGKLPGVLCPHGHWANGRFYDAGEANAKKEMESGAEKTLESARYPLQARCAMLARLGCVVFHYDMVGYADSKAITHRTGFTDAEAELRLQSFMGLQTWNSIRSLDFLLSLPEVDPTRIGVTGASGGGTQTFILCAVDDRPTVAFPAVMVSTAMQGGCVCENCSYLRIDAGNIDLAALFAPKPLAMSGAKDWTIDIETKGLPELKAVYKLYGAEDRVLAKCFPQFGHNYNQVSREVMYNWFNKHLRLGHKEPIEEKPFQPVPSKELSVFDAQHPMPKDAVDARRLRETMTELSDRQIRALVPRDGMSLGEFRRVIGTGLRAMVGGGVLSEDEIEVRPVPGTVVKDGVAITRSLICRKGSGEQVPVISLVSRDSDGTVVVWVHPQGKASLWRDGKLVPEARRILESKAAILAVDVLDTGELQLVKPSAVNKSFAGFTYGYNRPLLAHRVRDILTAVAAARAWKFAKKVHLVGFGEAGSWVLLARGLCGDAVARTAADVNGFRFESVRSVDDPMMLPGALKYGGLPAFTALAAPGELLLHGHRGTGMGRWVKPAYEAAKAGDRLKTSGQSLPPEEVVAWLLR
jgi:hypothetical protein